MPFYERNFQIYIKKFCDSHLFSIQNKIYDIFTMILNYIVRITTMLSTVFTGSMPMQGLPSFSYKISGKVLCKLYEKIYVHHFKVDV